MQDHQSETHKNMQAENQRIRKHVWGYNEPQASDEMNQTILGDVTHPTPIVIQGQQSSWVGKVLAGAALGAALFGIPAAGVAGYFASRMLAPKTATEPVATDPIETETIDLGLLRFEDLQGPGE
jgi:predicted phage tail protein